MNKIVHLIFGLQVGGAENLLIDIANEQVKTSSVSVIIINSKYEKSVVERMSKDIRVIYIERKEGNKWNPVGIIKIWKWLFSLNPGIIHCHNHKLIGLLVFWKNKSVITVHDVGVPIANLKKYKKVFSISAAVQDDLLKRGNLGSSVVYNGIEFDLIQKKEAHFYNETEVYKILQVSRLNHDKKGQHIAIQALKKLHELGYANINLYFIGDGPSLHYLKKLSWELNLEQNVVFLGARTRAWVYKNLCKFDLLVQPSLYEGFGLTIIEGIAAGLPVVASRVDGPAEILKEIPSGFLFEAGHVDDYVCSIQNVIALTVQNKIQNLCSISYDMVCQKYSINQTASNYSKFYPVS